MAGFIQAVALDFDGTLTEAGRPCDAVLDAIAGLRREDVAIVLVTGRILAELDSDFPGLWRHFDAVIGENGGVLRIEGVDRELARPVEEALDDALAARGVTTRRGKVLLACGAEDSTIVAQEIGALGLDCHVLRNRSALMILPSDVSKASGLLAALSELAISPHNTVAVGDAENDLALLQTAEIGVAVANAVPSLRRHADLVLERPDGEGVAALLTGPLISGEQVVRPQRRRLRIGTFADGQPATIPGAQANVLICGETGIGKSYMAGLLVEQWTSVGYSVLVLDVEGDHVGLDRLHNVVVLAEGDLPSAHEVLAMLRQQALSVVIDLSGRPSQMALGYVQTLTPALEAERAAYGVPHWLVIDEAHQTFADGALGEVVLTPAERGFCFVTYRPEQLSGEVLASIDITISMTSTAGGAEHRGLGAAMMKEKDAPARPFDVGRRRTPHVRHWHKYAANPLTFAQWFHFRYPNGNGAGAASDLRQFMTALRDADALVVEHHLNHCDFSRWLSGSIRDHELGAAVAAIERSALARRAADLERARERIIDEIELRYLTGER